MYARRGTDWVPFANVRAKWHTLDGSTTHLPTDASVVGDHEHQEQSRNSVQRQRMARTSVRAAYSDARNRCFFLPMLGPVTIADVLTGGAIFKGGFYHIHAKEDLACGNGVQHSHRRGFETAQACGPQQKGGALDRFNAFSSRDEPLGEVQQGRRSSKFFY